MKTLFLITLFILSSCSTYERCAETSEKTCVPYIKFGENGERVEAYYNKCLQSEVDISQCSSVEIK